MELYTRHLLSVFSPSFPTVEIKAPIFILAKTYDATRDLVLNEFKNCGVNISKQLLGYDMAMRYYPGMQPSLIDMALFPLTIPFLFVVGARIYIENASDTIEEAEMCRYALSEIFGDTVAIYLSVITSEFHAKRTNYLFKMSFASTYIHSMFPIGF